MRIQHGHRVAKRFQKRSFVRECAIGLVSIAATLVAAQPVWADNFSEVHYDKNTNELVVTMTYRGTNPDHTFNVKWGACRASSSGKPSAVTVEVLDAQWNDGAQQTYTKTSRFSLSDLPCDRPAKVTLRTAPRFFYTLTIPGN